MNFKLSVLHSKTHVSSHTWITDTGITIFDEATEITVFVRNRSGHSNSFKIGSPSRTFSKNLTRQTCLLPSNNNTQDNKTPT